MCSRETVPTGTISTHTQSPSPFPSPSACLSSMTCPPSSTHLLVLQLWRRRFECLGSSHKQLTRSYFWEGLRLPLSFFDCPYLLLNISSQSHGRASAVRGMSGRIFFFWCVTHQLSLKACSLKAGLNIQYVTRHTEETLTGKFSWGKEIIGSLACQWDTINENGTKRHYTTTNRPFSSV